MMKSFFVILIIATTNPEIWATHFRPFAQRDLGTVGTAAACVTGFNNLVDYINTQQPNDRGRTIIDDLAKWVPYINHIRNLIVQTLNCLGIHAAALSQDEQQQS